MTFGRSPGDRSSSFGPRSAFDPGHHDAPYGGPVADGFGGRGRAPDGFGPEGVAGASPMDAGAEALHAEQGSSASGVGAAVGAAASASNRLAAPPQIDFGEIVAGENATESRPIFNLHPTYEAYVNVSLAGSPDFTVVGQPDRLRPSREGVGTPITIAYHPSRRADSKAVLRVTAGWQMGAWPSTTIEIPVVGKAYAPGEKSHADEAKAAAAAKESEQAAATEAARTAALGEAFERDLSKGPQEYEASTRLEIARQNASTMLALVTSEQREGVGLARDEVDAFRRRAPRSSQSLLFQLAMFALDAATAGIAGSLAVRLGRRISAFVPGTPRAEEIHGAVVWAPREVPSTAPENVAFVVEAFKAGFKQAGKSGREAAFHGGAAHAEGGVGSGETIDFFGGLASAVHWATADRALALTALWSHLLPTLRVAPDLAVATMDAMRDSLAEEAESAKKLQANEARLAWMRFLSQHALGSLDGKQATQLGLASGPNGSPITDVRGAASPPKDGGNLASVDGILDLEFEADYYAPEQPVTLKGGRITGVHPNMVRALAARPARDLGVVIRAHGTLAGMAAPPIVVVRDEAGNVRFSDDTGAPGQPSTWLSRKGGSLRSSPERQRLGAIRLMEEVLDKTLGELLPGDLVTDHEERVDR